MRRTSKRSPVSKKDVKVGFSSTTRWILELLNVDVVDAKNAHVVMSERARRFECWHDYLRGTMQNSMTTLATEKRLCIVLKTCREILILTAVKIAHVV